MTDAVKGHNKGPIGPLDPDQPPPAVPILKRHHRLRAKEAIEALRSMGVEITERDLEYYHARGEGPPHAMAPGQREYIWGHVLDWTAHTFPVPKLNRKQATKYICEELGYPIGPTVLSQLIYTPGRGPRYINQGRDTYYTKEALEEWVEEDRARGPRHSTAPKYLPLYAKRRCPAGTAFMDPDMAAYTLALVATLGTRPLPEHKGCPWVKHPDCASRPRALCNLIHLPLDPALFAAYEKRGIIRLLRTKRPDALDIKAYLRDWAEINWTRWGATTVNG
jgi:hypothetical protein